MSNTELVRWMDTARVGPRELARRLAANGHAVTSQRISQWRMGDPISAYWQAALEQVVQQVDSEDAQRMADRMSRRATAEVAR